MLSITREFGFDMGHCLPDHQGACYRPHGHRYRCEVTIEGEVNQGGPDRAMIRDFADMADSFKIVMAHFDHRFAMAMDDPRLAAALETFGHDAIVVTPAPPTAETLGALIGFLLAEAGMPPTEVRLWETPTCSATWRP